MKILNLIFILLLIFLSACAPKDEKIDVQTQIIIEKNSEFFDDYGRVFTYENGPYNKMLLKCAYVKDRNNSCPINELPLIGQTDKKITIKSILNRTLVSHKELGDTFKAALLELNSDILYNMFGSVTSIIISDKINPSFYHPYTGAIYISARYLWTNENMKKLAFNTVDSRENAVSSTRWASLNYEILEVYLLNNRSIRASTYVVSRDISELKTDLFKLLIHELTHANDYFPKSYYDEMSSSEKEEKIGLICLDRFRKKQLISHQFPTSPINQNLYLYARVLFHGHDLKSTNLESFNSTDIANFFSSDLAVDMYGYSTTLEDLATLVTDYILLGELGVEKKISLITHPSNNFTIPSDYTYKIAWGSKNRILKNEIIERANYGMSKIFPELNLDQYYVDKLSKYKHEEKFEDMSWRDFLYHTKK